MSSPNSSASNAARAARRRAASMAVAMLAPLLLAAVAAAHPLGNFTVNHFAGLRVGPDRLSILYVIDMAEIPAFQELQAADANQDGTASREEVDAHAARIAAAYVEGLRVTAGEQRIPLRLTTQRVSQPPGASGLATLRIECDLEGTLPAAGGPQRVRFENTGAEARLGWREVAVAPSTGAAVFDSTAFANSLSDELRVYPEESLMAPLDERAAEFTVVAGVAPEGAAPLRTRDGAAVVQTRDRFAELIAVKELTLPVVLLGLLVAAGLGALHALSPGHGKAVVGAYLVGNRGTARHAAFLGLTVTITHTAGVFALGAVTLLASRYVMPERLMPILSLISGAIVLAIGLRMLVVRVRAAFGLTAHDHNIHHHHDHDHDHGHDHHDHGWHSHGGTAHTHLPPGADGAPITWRSLLALGISGGLLPCPSALVVMLAAISFNRVEYGFLLVLAFSLGLAGALTAVGMLFVYGGRLLRERASFGAITRAVPVVGAALITCIGAAICYEALAQMQTLGAALMAEESRLAEATVAGLLGLGLLFGLKHATEADHVIAVSTIVTEHRSLWRAALVGAMWGAGHTATILVVGVVVLGMRVTIPEAVSGWLEFAVAMMIVLLGASVLVRAIRSRRAVHVYEHTHDGLAHTHVVEDGPRAGLLASIGLKPLFVGAVHGLAGSAPLTVLVLTQIDSLAPGLLYLATFGVGSIGGMLLMSGLIGLPFALTPRSSRTMQSGLTLAAGLASIAFGIWYAYETGVLQGVVAGLIGSGI